jgi:hypothetical protein
MPEKLDENEGRWCAVGGERPWPSAERSGGRQVTDDDEPAKLIFYFEIAWRGILLDRGRALGRLPTAATRSGWSLFLAGVHSDGSFLKAAVVGSVASQEAVQHVQAR